MNLNLLSGAIGGLVGALATFLLRDWCTKDNNYCIALKSTKNELIFYLEKFKLLVQMISDIHTNLAKDLPYNFSSFSLYPSFLEKCKINLNSFFGNADLVKEIGQCHFDLCHILNKLNISSEELSNFQTITKETLQELNINIEELHRIETTTSTNRMNFRQKVLINLQSLQELIENNINYFNQTITNIDTELEHYKYFQAPYSYITGLIKKLG